MISASGSPRRAQGGGAFQQGVGQRQAEGDGLARAGLGRNQQIAAFRFRLHHRHLHGRGVFIVALGKGAGEGGMGVGKASGSDKTGAFGEGFWALFSLIGPKGKGMADLADFLGPARLCLVSLNGPPIW